MSDAKAAELAFAKAQERTKEQTVSDAKALALAQAKAQAKAKNAALAASGQAPLVVGTGPLGLPAAVSVFGVNVPSIFVLGVVGLVVLVGAALAIHAVRSK